MNTRLAVTALSLSVSAASRFGAETACPSPSTAPTAKTAEKAAAVNPALAGARGFDFLLGEWLIHNRRLRERLNGSSEWLSFEARSSERLILNGLGIEEEYRTNYWPGFVGMAIRVYNPKNQRWAIHWLDSQRGQLEPAVYGTFDGDVGIFEGDDYFNGKPIRVRFTWSRIHSGTPRWEQAFSADGGVSWETNWVMDFTRAEPRYLSLPCYEQTGLSALAWMR